MLRPRSSSFAHSWIFLLCLVGCSATDASPNQGGTLQGTGGEAGEILDGSTEPDDSGTPGDPQSDAGPGDPPKREPLPPGAHVAAGFFFLEPADLMIDADNGGVAEGAITLRSDADGPLEYKVESDASWLEVSMNSGSVAPDGSVAIGLRAKCNDDKTHIATLTVSTAHNGGASVKATIRQVCWGGPITITEAGTYEGNWRSSVPGVAAVEIKTGREQGRDKPVVIQDCYATTVGPTPIIRGDFVDVTIRDCYAYGRPSNQATQPPSQFFRTTQPSRVVIENNYLERVSFGVFIENSGNNTPLREVFVRNNRVRNIDGRTSGSGCSGSDLGLDRAGVNCASSFLATNLVHGAQYEIAYNEIINEPYQGNQEIIINLVNSRGTADSPIRIHDNYLQGQYPADPLTQETWGGGINGGDSTDGASGDRVPSHVWIYDNQVVSITAGAIATVAGNHFKFYGNRVVSSGRLPSGELFRNHDAGFVIWDCCYNHVESGFWSNIEVYDNESGYVGRGGDRVDFRFEAPLSRNENNRSIPGDITHETERQEYERWRHKIRDNNIEVGPRW